MSAVRSSLLRVVEEDIRNPVVGINRAVLVEQTRDKIQRNFVDRVFDPVPHLLDRQVTDGLAYKYLQILAGARFINDDVSRPNVFTRLNIERWTTDIINIAIRELLDEKGKLREEIIEYFGWGDLRSYLDPMKLIRSYLGSIVGQVAQDYQEIITTHHHSSCGPINNYLSTHANELCKAAMIEHGYMASTSDIVAVAAGVAGGVGLLAGAVIALGFFAGAARGASAGAGSAADVTRRLI